MLIEKEKLTKELDDKIKDCQTEIESIIACIDMYKKAIDRWHLKIVEQEERISLLEKCKASLND